MDQAITEAKAVAAAAIREYQDLNRRKRAEAWRQRLQPFRAIGLWLWQRHCGLSGGGHLWDRGRELDLGSALPFHRNPWIDVCPRCGATAVRETDPQTGW